MPALTPDQVAEARQLYASGGFAATTLAVRFGCGRNTMIKALKGVRRGRRSPDAWDTFVGQRYNQQRAAEAAARRNAQEQPGTTDG